LTWANGNKFIGPSNLCIFKIKGIILMLSRMVTVNYTIPMAILEKDNGKATIVLEKV
jgi:hypothetical protein